MNKKQPDQKDILKQLHVVIAHLDNGKSFMAFMHGEMENVDLNDAILFQYPIEVISAEESVRTAPFLNYEIPDSDDAELDSVLDRPFGRCLSEFSLRKVAGLDSPSSQCAKEAYRSAVYNYLKQIEENEANLRNKTKLNKGDRND
jgi:hypothetical protein